MKNPRTRPTRKPFLAALLAVLIVSPSFAAQDASASDELESMLNEHSAHRHAQEMDHMKMAQAAANDCRTFSPNVSPTQIAAISALVGQRGHRIQHALWHATRGGLSPQDAKDEIDAFGDSWGASHPYCPPPAADVKASNYNPVGEDFLYMHRQMIGAVRDTLIHHQPPLPCIEGWTHVPSLREAPLPDNGKTGAKSPGALRQLQAWDRTLQDPKWLASHSLSQLGMAAELTTHNNLHMRYATTRPPAGFPGIEQTGGAPVPFDGKFPADWPYDKAAYNWLADPYGAALNPFFWKIHGYVDHLIDLWLQAHGYASIAENCAGAPKCYQWRGTWTGSVPDFPPAKSVEMADKATTRSPYPQTPDPRTRNFNQKRMLRQWAGVLGDHPLSDAANERAATPNARAAAPPIPADPFSYAVEQLCSSQNGN